MLTREVRSLPERIADKDQTRLLETPESGMGYQLVMGNRVLILNATVAFRLDERRCMAAEDLRWLYVKCLPLFDDIEPSPDTYDSGWASQRELLAGLDKYTDSVEVEERGSCRSVARYERFIRYSAVWPDRRIASDGSVGTGTYATTENDKTVVPSGLAAVGRYALPNPAPAVFEYVIGPVKGETILCGTCAPQFGQAGGGVEIRVVNRLGPGSANPIPVRIRER